MKKLMRNDLTGKRFGKLTVLYVDAERSKDGKVYWYCQCDCGSEPKSIQSTSLTRKIGGTKSCGCARNSQEAQEKSRMTRESYPADISGLRFGRLTVINKTNMRSSKSSDNGASLWKCKCDCGEICYYSRYSLISKFGVKSCGCLYFDSRKTTWKKYCTYDLENYEFGVGYCNNGTHFFFDKEDYNKIKDYSWWYDGRYVCAHSLIDDKYTTKIIRLHRVVMDLEDREEISIDHKNLVRYDCRKSNLRRATASENAANVDHSHNSSTGIVGVFKIGDNKWRAQICNKGTHIYLGTYDNIEDAAEARFEAELKYFKDFRFDMSNKDIIDEVALSNIC